MGAEMSFFHIEIQRDGVGLKSAAGLSEVFLPVGGRGLG